MKCIWSTKFMSKQLDFSIEIEMNIKVNHFLSFYLLISILYWIYSQI